MKEFNDIEAVILDKDGVFVNFHKVWLRVIAYRAQLIAEMAAETSEALAAIRTACIRSMGVDEEDETVDPCAPCSMPGANVRLALATALFITKYEFDPTFSWTQAFAIVDKSMDETREALNLVDLSEPIEGSVEKIKELADAGFKLAVYTSDAPENTEATLEKFGLTDTFAAVMAGMSKNKDNYLELCQELKVDPSKTLLLTDSPTDLKAGKDAGANTITVFSGVIDEGRHDSLIAELSDENLASMAALDLGAIKKKVAS